MSLPYGTAALDLHIQKPNLTHELVNPTQTLNPETQIALFYTVPQP